MGLANGDSSGSTWIPTTWVQTHRQLGVCGQSLGGGFKHVFIFHNIWDNPSH